MNRLMKTLWSCIGNILEEIAEAIEDGEYSYAVKKVFVLLATALSIIGFLVLLVALLYAGRKVIFAVVSPILIVALLMASYRVNYSGGSCDGNNDLGDEVDEELAYQRGLEMQGYAMSFMLRVLVAISSFTVVNRPRTERDIEAPTKDGASFYMKNGIVIYQAEVEIEGDGEVTKEVEDILQREIQRYALKYISDYPMLISPEAGGCAPVEVLAVKNCGNRVLIDFVFTTRKALTMIDTRRRARIERQKRQERPRPYIDEDYGE